MYRALAFAFLGLALLLDQTAAAQQRKVVGAAALAEQASVRGAVRLIATLTARQGPELESARRQLDARLAAVGVRQVVHLGRFPYAALRANSTQLRALLASGLVGRVSEDRAALPSLAESVPLIGGIEAARLGATGRGWAVAVLDTGVETAHPFLSGKVVAEACFTDQGCRGGTGRQIGPGAGQPCPFFGCDHGTHVAGIAVGRGASFSGVASAGGLIAIQVFDDCGPCTYSSNLIRALDHVLALASRYHIAAVNMSLGGGLFDDFCDYDELKLPIDLLRARGIATVVASHNQGAAGAIASPACISSAIAVGATYDDPADERITEYSNIARMVDLLAPGSYINSSIPGGLFANFSGTSMAAPHVAGAWAALKSKFPTASVGLVESMLKATGKRLTDPDTGLAIPRIRVDRGLHALATANTRIANGAS